MAAKKDAHLLCRVSERLANIVRAGVEDGWIPPRAAVIAQTQQLVVMARQASSQISLLGEPDDDVRERVLNSMKNRTNDNS